MFFFSLFIAEQEPAAHPHSGNEKHADSVHRRAASVEIGAQGSRADERRSALFTVMNYLLIRLFICLALSFNVF